MNMQQMMMQAQKMQRELQKAQKELEEKEFSVTKAGLVTVTVMGSKEVKSIIIDKDGFDADNKEMVEELIVTALNELFAQIDEASAAINERITGRAGGFGF